MNEYLEITDFGSILQQLRENAGYSRAALSNMLGKSEGSIRSIEESKTEIPDEKYLRRWLKVLGCVENLPKLLEAAHRFRLSQQIKLRRNEPCNPDISRLIQAYKLDKISNYDRALLKLIARVPDGKG